MSLIEQIYTCKNNSQVFQPIISAPLSFVEADMGGGCEATSQILLALLIYATMHYILGRTGKVT